MRCGIQDYACDSSPYKVISLSKTTPNGTAVELAIIFNPTANKNATCYSELRASLQRLTLLTRKFHAESAMFSNFSLLLAHQHLVVGADSACSASWSSLRISGQPPLILPLWKNYSLQAEFKVRTRP